CTITALPTMSLGLPSPSVAPRSRLSTVATPWSSAAMLSLSPAWCSPSPTRPCALAVGLKWPPALVASGALQSPFSCTWKPCWPPGGRPVTSPVMRIPPSTTANSRLPATALPSVGARAALAEAAAGAGSGVSAMAGVGPGPAPAASPDGASGWPAADSSAAGRSSRGRRRPGTPPARASTGAASARAGRGAEHQQRAAKDIVAGAAPQHRSAHDQADPGHALGVGEDAAGIAGHRAVLARARERLEIAAGAARVDGAAVAALVHLQPV